MQKSRFWKLAIVLTVMFGAIGTAYYFGLFYPQYWQAVRQERAARQIWNELEAQKRREAQDPYGGKTPQEVYQLFVQALEKQDIDLAVKYFAFEKQEKVKQRLTRIQNNNEWQFMYDDLSGKTAQIEYEELGDGAYDINIIEVRNQGLIASFRAKQNPNSNLWKLTEFW